MEAKPFPLGLPFPDIGTQALPDPPLSGSSAGWRGAPLGPKGRTP